MTSDPTPYREAETGEIYDVASLEESLAKDNRSDDVIEEEQAKRKYTKGVVIAVLLVGIVFGIWLDHNVITPPVYVYGPAPSVTITEHEKEIIHDQVKTVPESCRETLTLISKMEPYLKSVLGSSGKISDILEQARVAITMSDHKSLVDASQQNNTLSNEMSSARTNLQDLMRQYETAQANCIKDLG